MGNEGGPGRARSKERVRTKVEPAADGRRGIALIVALASLLVILALLLSLPGQARAASGDRAEVPAAQTDNVVIYDRGTYKEVHLDVAGAKSPYDLGYQYGIAIMAADWWWEKKCWLYLTGAHFLVVDYATMKARASAIKQNLPADVRGMIEGMAAAIQKKGWGLLNENDCYVLNLFPDVARETQCSAVGAWGPRAAGGKPIVGRVLDWSDDDLLPTIHAIQVFHNGSKSFCSVGFLGLLQVISGFNQKGLFGAILDAPTGKPYPDPVGRRSYPMDLRTALETTANIEAAAKVLQPPHDYCFSHQILLADKSRVGVLENDLTSTGALARKVRYDTTALNDGITWTFPNSVCAVNSFVAKGNDSASFATPWNKDRWQDYQAQMRTVGGNITVKTMEDMISHGKPDDKTMPYNFQTVQMMVFQPATGHLDLFLKPKSGLPKNPSFASIDINFGASAFAGRWQQSWQPAGWDVSDARVVTASNGDVCVATGLSRAGGPDEAIGVVCYRSDGTRRWSKLIDPAGEAGAALGGIAAAPGAVVVGGTRLNGAEKSWLLTRYALTGKRSWQVTGAAGSSDELGGLVCDATGNTYAGGAATVADSAATSPDWRLSKYSPKGRRLWQKTLGSGPGLTDTIAEVTRLGGSTIVAGAWAADAATGRIAVARYTDAGAQSWFTPWAEPTFVEPGPTGLAARESGVAVAGWDIGAGRSRRLAFRLDPADGAIDWSFVDPPAAAGQIAGFSDVAIDNSGRVTAAGFARTVAGASESCLLTWFADDGSDQISEFGAAGGSNLAFDVVAGAGGETYVTGTQWDADAGHQAMFLSNWLPIPRQEWIVEYQRSTDRCTGRELVLSADSVYVAGIRGFALLLAKYPQEPLLDDGD